MPLILFRLWGMNAHQQKLIAQYIAAYNRFDVDGMCACLHPDIHFENWSGGQLTLTLDGMEAFRAQAHAACAYFSKREQTILQFMAKQDRVLLEIGYKATLAVDFPNGMKAGETLQLQGKSEFGLRNGLIIILRDES